MGYSDMIPAVSNLISLFGQSNPYDRMSGYYSQFQNRLNPYLNAGEHGLSGWQTQLDKLANNPTWLEDSIMGNYSQSPWAKYQMGQMTDSANRAAAAGGYVGTPQEQQALMEKAQGISSQDQQAYLQNAMQPYEMGVQGLGQEAGLGMNALNLDNQFMENMANMQGGATQWNNQRTGNLWGTLGGLAQSFMPQDYGGGFMNSLSGQGGGGGGMFGMGGGQGGSGGKGQGNNQQQQQQAMQGLMSLLPLLMTLL